MYGCASTPFENWSKEDTMRQAVYSVAHIIDWAQTRDICDSEKFYELNPVLGKNPSKSKVDIWMGSTLILQTVASGLIDEKWRPWWQTFWIGAEVGTVYHNYQIGLGFGF